jgi:hypothetical protein
MPYHILMPCIGQRMVKKRFGGFHCLVNEHKVSVLL